MKQKAREFFLPREVKAWMCYTKSGTMRRAMFTEGGYTDTHRGWTIGWDSRSNEYFAREPGENRCRSIESPRKADVYRYVNGLTRTS